MGSGKRFLEERSLDIVLGGCYRWQKRRKLDNARSTNDRTQSNEQEPQVRQSIHTTIRRFSYEYVNLREECKPQNFIEAIEKDDKEK